MIPVRIRFESCFLISQVREAYRSDYEMMARIGLYRPSPSTGDAVYSDQPVSGAPWASTNEWREWYRMRSATDQARREREARKEKNRAAKKQMG